MKSTKEAADYLGIPERTLRDMRKSRRGPAFHKYSPRIVKYDQAELDRYLDQTRDDPATMPRLRGR